MNKFAAPKATLMSYIIKGILNAASYPWTLVILGGDDRSAYWRCAASPP